MRAEPPTDAVVIVRPVGTVLSVVTVVIAVQSPLALRDDTNDEAEGRHCGYLRHSGGSAITTAIQHAYNSRFWSLTRHYNSYNGYNCCEGSVVGEWVLIARRHSAQNHRFRLAC